LQFRSPPLVIFSAYFDTAYMPDADLSGLTNTELVEGITRADYEVINEFYLRFHRTLGYVAVRAGAPGQDVEDIVHETIFEVVKRLQAGHELRNPECLPGFLRTVVRRTVFLFREKDQRTESSDRLVTIESGSQVPFLEAYQSSHRYHQESARTAEQDLMLEERRDLLREALAHLKPRDVEILTRFYLLEQPASQIMAEMGLAETPYRLNKSRAKKYLELAAARIQKQRARKQLPLAA
jgi:RNA polymerase sigma factor (sigma-70 family)